MANYIELSHSRQVVSLSVNISFHIFKRECNGSLPRSQETSTRHYLERDDFIYICTQKLYRPNDRRLSAKLVPTFADRGRHVVSATNPHGSILGFLDRSRYSFFHVAPQLYLRGWVHPVPDPLLLKKSGSAGNRTWTSGSVARNSDH
jgi:hypothetical protein